MGTDLVVTKKGYDEKEKPISSPFFEIRGAALNEYDILANRASPDGLATLRNGGVEAKALNIFKIPQ
ncbi:hypothetical protein EAH_00004340 [Eimeria acervulina]|uniref:Uncharacterized protein n=1 Tax=Eimeria acervulina TaxID=5801 RepID=U6GA61_EIMAC|nr:hypothetical protein EAH_00004340 [Eimeria acervulina]CDI77141.1 hypothetical protein EAH_00004340 [Eimeria acervulina]